MAIMLSNSNRAMTQSANFISVWQNYIKVVKYHFNRTIAKYDPHSSLTSSSCDSHSRSRFGNLSESQAETSSVSLNTIPFSSAQRVPRVSTVRPGTSNHSFNYKLKIHVDCLM